MGGHRDLAEAGEGLLVGDGVPKRRVLTCVRRGGRGHPLVARGLRALRDAVPDRCVPAAA
ncbi:hypothetical protein AB0C69_29480 [Actinomadura sp. NPDC048032]|uniref:hypothetical protein n=1 Tax=Actinomadura sp. NPDC048032 TaxID=3155747 RepID=UPI0033E21814